MYIVLAPLSLLVLYKRVVQILDALRDKNRSKLKADIFFLILTLVIIILLVWLIEKGWWLSIFNPQEKKKEYLIKKRGFSRIPVNSNILFLR